MVKKIIPVFIFVVVAFTTSPVAARGPVRVKISPFAVHGAGEYLGPGLASMIASRLGVTGGIRVVEKTAAADYLLNGSVTAIGKSYSLDLSLEPVAAGAVARGFFATAAGEDGLMAAVDDLSARVRSALSGSGALKAKTTVVKSGVKEKSLRNVHPERPFINPSATVPVAAAPVPVAGSVGASVPALRVPVRKKIMGVKRFDKSGNISFGAAAMAMGDVDGDGEAEFVFATPRTVRVYRLKGRDFLLLATVDLPARTRMHFIDAADLDGDGRAEILVSGNDEWIPNSLILDFDGKELVTRAGAIPWFIRALTLADGKVVLAGQQAGFDKPIGREINRLRFTGAAVEDTGRLNIPLGLDMFTLAFADIDGDHKAEIIAVDQSDKLSVYRIDGRLLWRSSADFAGVNRFLGGDRDTGGFTETDDTPGAREYLATRIEVADVNGDGIDEVVVNRNPGNFSRILARSRIYSGGEINVLAWDGIGMASIWKSPAIEGYVIGNHLIRNAGHYTVAVGLVLKTGWLGKLKADESAVLFFDLNS